MFRLSESSARRSGLEWPTLTLVCSVRRESGKMSGAMKGIFASENALALDSLDGSGASHFQVVAQHGSSRRLLRPIAGHLCGSKPDGKDPPRIWETHLVGAVG